VRKLALYQAFSEELVAQDPDITLFELRDALAAAEGVAVHLFLDRQPPVASRFHMQKSRWWPRNAGVPRQGARAKIG